MELKVNIIVLFAACSDNFCSTMYSGVLKVAMSTIIVCTSFVGEVVNFKVYKDSCRHCCRSYSMSIRLFLNCGNCYS